MGNRQSGVNNSASEKRDCFHCVHFAITWEPNHPRSCKLFGFKSAKLPSIAVEQSSGAPCEGFERKPKR
ncbi:MAG: uracil-DNA glycosylase [Oscillospiraceae bacterium]|nr:uracil-DNA glycosylase [Oscillospiraceae bacterium]